MPGFILCCVFALCSCKKENPSPSFPQPMDSVQRINRWILDSMYYYYYWNSNISSTTSLAGAPEDFFHSLLNTGDPFSWISDGRGIGPSKSSFDLYGFHYVLVGHPINNGKLLGVITLAASESAADRAGLARGIYFSKVNTTEITASNMASINELLQAGGAIKLTLVKDSAGVWKEVGSITLTASFFEERPVYKTALFEKNGKKTGYLFYNAFDELFDGDVLNAFATLRSKNVTEFILDLRYNPGGSVASAAKLSALLSGVKSTDVFAIYKGNNNLKTVSQTFEKAINISGNQVGKNFTELQANRLPVTRVFILSTRHTASAAELLINNLKPWVTVVHIGETTLGKDMAGVVIRDQRQPKQVQWFMQPLVYKLFNSLDKGGYSAGIVPEYVVQEFQSLPLAGLGEHDDPLVGKALTVIYGSNDVNTELLRKKTGSIYKIDSRSLMYNSMDGAPNGRNGKHDIITNP